MLLEDGKIYVGYILRYNMEIKQILQYPRLDTVLMVEKTIRKFEGKLKKKYLSEPHLSWRK